MSRLETPGTTKAHATSAEPGAPPASPRDPLAQDATTPPAPAKPVPRWAIHRRLYDWVLSLAHHRHGTWALFLLSFAESSFFPVPPDVLQIALTLERRERAWYFATVSTLASVLGGLLGYLIGWGFWEATQDLFYRYVPGFTPEVYQRVHDLYGEWNFWIVFAAAFTPIPYKVFTIAGGVFGVFLPMFVVASLVGRGARFFIVAALLWKFGPPVKGFIDRWFNLLCVIFTVLVVGGFALLKFVL